MLRLQYFQSSNSRYGVHKAACKYITQVRNARNDCFPLHDNGLLLSVSDDGNGFDKDSLQKAANPYFTGESNHSEHFGLGLYICKLLCEHHNGYLQIRNTVNGANVSAYFKSPTL